MRKILPLIFVLSLILNVGAQQLVEPFDGAITEWYDDWSSGDGYTIRSYDSTLAGHEGAAALKVEWKLDIVDYGGGCSFARLLNPGENIDMSDYDTLTIWYYIEKPMTFEYKDSIAFSLILLDNHDQADFDASGAVEMWGFDAYGVYENSVGWHEIFIPLEESDSRETGLMMQGDALNGEFDPDAIKGFYLEWGNWEKWFADTTDTIADSGVVYFDNMVLGTVLYTGINDRKTTAINTYQLDQNYPNPFNPETTISYSIPTTDHVSVTVYNVNGKKVKTLVNENKSAGTHQLRFDARFLTTGVYFYHFKSGSYSDIKKMIMIK